MTRRRVLSQGVPAVLATAVVFACSRADNAGTKRGASGGSSHANAGGSGGPTDGTGGGSGTPADAGGNTGAGADAAIGGSNGGGRGGMANSGSPGAGGGAGRGGTAGGGSSGAGGATASGGKGGAPASGGKGGAPASGGKGGAGGAAAVRWVGRVDESDPSAVAFAWQGAGFVATVNGATIAVKLRTEGTDTVFFQPVIDGTAGTRFEVRSGSDQIITIASGLPAADHKVELYRDTEGMYGKSTFLGFTSGTVKAPPPARPRLIEVIGDSVSAGYGDLGSEPHPNWTANPACHWTAANSTWYQTYASVAGHALNADVSTIARSGWGMYRDLSGDTSGVLSSVYADTVGTSATPKWGFAPKPDVVVINLGTNDWAKGDPGMPYETAYLDFLKVVRGHYPDAWLFLTIGSMLGDPALGQVTTHLSAVVKARAAAGDSKIFTFDFGTQPLGSDGSVPTGCDWHPNVADHQRMAAILKTQLQAKLGW